MTNRDRGSGRPSGAKAPRSSGIQERADARALVSTDKTAASTVAFNSLGGQRGSDFKVWLG
jgi:hypothetical protein